MEMLSKVNSNTEWGTLKEVILGNAEFARVPVTKYKDIHCVDYANYDMVNKLPGGSYPSQVIEETKEDLNLFQTQLESVGVKVLRPDIVNHAKYHSSPNWTTDGYYSYCPRDSVLVIGDMLIETPMVLRSRFFETYAYRNIFKEYFKAGSKWISAPKPELLDELYDRTDLSKPTLTDFEPAFDAANVVKCGKDLFYLVSNSGNKIGAQWLQTILGDKYTVHILENIYAYVHLDTSIMPLAPGVVLLNPDRVNENNCPKYFKSWKKIYCEKPEETPYLENWAPASPWLGMNVLSISDKLVAVENRQTNIIKQLESNGFDVMPIQMRHCRTLSGGPHCATLDTVRDDEYGDYK
jgi:glycine amidinotransferase/scyllo-inosamine-4-phosphate amidinotransferase 1